MNIADTILSQGADSAVALLHGEVRVTYVELRDAVARCSASLRSRGHRKSERIGIFAENSPFFVKAYLGILHAGLVAVPLPADSTAESFGRIVGDAGIKEIFVSNRLLKRARLWADKLELTLQSESRETCFAGDPLCPSVPVNATRDLAALMFTSGSTGTPKGVMITHRNIECNARDIIAYLGLYDRDRIMAVLPFHYCFGLSLLHTHLMAGASIVLNNNFKLFPESVLLEMQERECTGFAGVPSTYQILLRNSRFRQMTFPKLRLFQQAGGKLPNACIREILEAFPDVRFFLMYGQTEGTARLSYLPPDRLADKLGSIGRGLPSTRLEVLGAYGSPVEPGSDAIGEIVASGDNVAAGYWNDPAETARFFRKGRLHTGDLARVDRDGFIFVVEREREIIKSGGNRVSAKEVEDTISEIPEVVEVAVVGAPHELLGESIVAFVVACRGAVVSERDVLAHCQKRLPPSKCPHEVVFVRGLPHNHSGKILKAELKTRLNHTGAVQGSAGGKTEHLRASQKSSHCTV